MQEESISFETKKIFYNPNMQFCRSFFSLAAGALNGKLQVLDGFSATGIRGIRYQKENKNIQQIGFLEANDDAIPVLRKNLKRNKLKGKIIHQLYEKYLASGFFFYDLIEIDPFGTPVPYLWSTFYGQQKKKQFYLSVTATDTAVLCGPEARACQKNYHSKSLNNEFTHETGTRILIKRIMESANEFDFGIVPLVSLSDRHYIKLLLKCDKGAAKAKANCEQLGYVSYCNNCAWRESSKRMKNECKSCNATTDYAGPLWLGALHDNRFLKKMLKLTKRKYAHIREIGKILGFMLDEADMPPFYYDLHVLAQKWKLKGVPQMEMVLTKLRKRKFSAARTHFAATAIKTDADFRAVQDILI